MNNLEQFLPRSYPHSIQEGKTPFKNSMEPMRYRVMDQDRYIRVAEDIQISMIIKWMHIIYR